MAESAVFVVRHFLVACLIASISNLSLLVSNYVVSIMSWMTDGDLPGSRQFEVILTMFSMIFGLSFYFAHVSFARRILDINFSNSRFSAVDILQKLVFVGGSVFFTVVLYFIFFIFFVRSFSASTLIVDSSSFDIILLAGAAGLAAGVSIIKKQ